MIVQISSGQGPAECELAVVKLFNSLKSEYKDIEQTHLVLGFNGASAPPSCFLQMKIYLPLRVPFNGSVKVHSVPTTKEKTGM